MRRFQETAWQGDLDTERKRKEKLDTDFALTVGKLATPEWQDVASIAPFPETQTDGFHLAQLIAKLNPGVEVKQGNGGKTIEIRRLLQR